MQITLTLAVFALTLALILLRPRGLHEAWATMLGGGLMLALRLETPAQAWRTVAQGADVLLFLLGLLILSEELKASGFLSGRQLGRRGPQRVTAGRCTAMCSFWERSRRRFCRWTPLPSF